MISKYRRLAIERSRAEPRGIEVAEKDQWVLNLSIAVVKQAADDLRAALKAHDESEAAVLLRWFWSEWGQLLSFGQGGAIVRRIKKEEEEREQNET